MATVKTANVDERLAWVDYAKGICIVLVVLMYTSFQLGGATGAIHRFVEFAKPFRMPDFFFLSGLFLARVIDRDRRSYVDAKVLHFAYFYVLWTGLHFVTRVPLWAARGDWQALGQIPLALVNPVSSLWFIYVLPLFFLAVRFLRERGVPMGLAFVVAAMLESLRLDTGWRALDEFCARGIYFLGGYLLAPLAFSVAAWVGRHPARAALAIATWAFVNGWCVFTASPFCEHTRISEVPLLSIALGFVGALGVISTAALLERLGALTFLRRCGQSSIVIYLAFFLALDPLKKLSGRLHLSHGVATVAIAAIAIATSLLLARAVRGTRLDFLFVRPARFRLDAPVDPASPRP